MQKEVEERREEAEKREETEEKERQLLEQSKLSVPHKPAVLLASPETRRRADYIKIDVCFYKCHTSHVSIIEVCNDAIIFSLLLIIKDVAYSVCTAIIMHIGFALVWPNVQSVRL